MTIAEIIIERRLKAGMTQKELAKKMAIPKYRLVEYENGKHEPSFLTYKNLVRICNNIYKI